MKKLLIPIFIVMLTTWLSFDAQAFNGLNLRKKNCPANHHGPVSAPLDGGLLALLAAAGVGYYSVRKNKVKK
jgi:hypothetical protein